MERARRLQIQQLGPELTCHLCHGYFVDAFTVVECLHSFCKSCIMEHVKKSCDCPTCGTQLNKARLTSALRPDQTLQSVVYKLVPRLFNDEMQRRRDFYQHHPRRDRSLSPERRGDVSSQQFVYTLSDPISFSLEYYRCGAGGGEKTELPAVRYFQAPAGLSVAHLKKLLHLKHGLAPHATQIDILYAGDILSEELIIMDVAYMYNWDRTAPMRFSYRYTTKRPAGGQTEPTAKPCKRRCPEPTAAELQSGADSDKENVENDARPATAVADGAPPSAAAAKPAGKAADAAQQATVGASSEASREPVTSGVTSPRAEAGAVADSPRGSAAERRPGAGAGGEGGAVSSGNGQTVISNAERGVVSNAERVVLSDAEKTVVSNSERGVVERTVLSNAEGRTVSSHVEKGIVSNVERAVVSSDEGPVPSNVDGAGASCGEMIEASVAKRTLVSSAKKSAVSNQEDGSALSDRIKANSVARNAGVNHPVAVSTSVEKRPSVPPNRSVKDAEVVSIGDVNYMDSAKRSTEGPPGPVHRAMVPTGPKSDGPNPTIIPNGSRICQKQLPNVSAHSKIPNIVPKSLPFMGNNCYTSKVPLTGGAFKNTAVTKPTVSQKEHIRPRAALNESVKRSVAQSHSAFKSSISQNVLSCKNGVSQNWSASKPTGLSAAANRSAHKPMTSLGSCAPKATVGQNGNASKPCVSQKVLAPNPSPAHKGNALIAPPLGTGPSTGLPASPASGHRDRVPSGGGGGGGGPVVGGTDPAPAADDRQCEDSGVDTDSSERPGADSARSPIDVYDFDAEAEDETAVRLKTVPPPLPLPEGRLAARPPAAVHAHAVRPPVMARMTPTANAVWSTAVSATDVRPAPPTTPGAAHVRRPPPPSTPGAAPMQRPAPPSTPGAALMRRPAPPSTPGATPMQRPAPPSTPGAAPMQRPAHPSTPAATVPPSPRRSLAPLPDLRPIGAGAIPLMTGQLDRFLRMVSQSAVSQPNGSWRLPADASSLLSRATAPTQFALGKSIQPKPASQTKPAVQPKPAVQTKPSVQAKPTTQLKPVVQPKSTTAKTLPTKTPKYRHRMSGAQGIQNLVTNEITITKIPNTSRPAAPPSSGAGVRPGPSPLPTELTRSPGPAPGGRITADGSVTIEKVRPPPPTRPPNSPKLLAIAESLAMRKLQGQRQSTGSLLDRTPPSQAAAAAAPSSALGSLISLSQTQQFHKQQQQQAAEAAPRGRPAASSSARCQIPNPALLHHQSQGRLTVLSVPPTEAAGTGTGTGATTSGSLARMERLTNSLGR